MEVTLLYWHWLVLGMLLMAAEIFVPSFTILWFGLGGILVGAILWLVPELAISWQLILWAGLSSAFAAFWFLVLKPGKQDKTKAGMAREAITGEIGQVVKKPAEHVRGVVRFTTPVLGDDEWEFICNDPVELGDRVIVTELSGNTLLVTKR